MASLNKTGAETKYNHASTGLFRSGIGVLISQFRVFVTDIWDSFAVAVGARTEETSIAHDGKLYLGDDKWISYINLMRSSGNVISKSVDYEIQTSDHGSIIEGTGGVVRIFTLGTALPVGFEIGFLSADGKIQIDSGSGTQDIGGFQVDDASAYLKPKFGTTTSYIFIKKIASGVYYIIDSTGIWIITGVYNTAENKTIKPSYQDVYEYDDTGGTSINISNVPLNTSDKILRLSNDGHVSLSFSGFGLEGAGSTCDVVLENTHASNVITLTLLGDRARGVNGTYSVLPGDVILVACKRFTATEALWTYCSKGIESSSNEAINSTGYNVLLSEKEAIYNDVNSPTSNSEITFNDTDGKNGATGFVYWQSNSNGDSPTLTYSGGDIEVISDEISPSAVHRIWYTFHKKTGVNNIQVIIKASNTPPQALNTTIAGVFSVGGSLTANWDYFDADGDAHDTDEDTYQWYRADDTSGTNEEAISGATDKIYILTGSDEGKHLKYIVIPMALTGSASGSATDSGYSESPIVAASLLIDIESTSDYTNPIEGPGSIGTIGIINISNGIGNVAYLPDIDDEITVSFNVPTTTDYRIYLRGRTGSAANYNAMAHLYSVIHDSTTYGCTSIVAADRPYVGPIGDLSTSYWGWTRTGVISLTSGVNTFKLKVSGNYCAIDQVELVAE